MKPWLLKVVFTGVVAVLLAGSVISATSAEPLQHRVTVDKLELVAENFGDVSTSSEYLLEGYAWIGNDVDKLWFKTDLKRRGGTSAHIEMQLLYGHALSAYWDLLVGVRRDALPRPDQNWGMIGVRGLAPLYVDAEAAIHFARSGQTSARLTLEKQLLLSNRLALKPRLEINVYGKNDDEQQTGAGLADLWAGVRILYEVRPDLWPYIGVDWSKKFGNTATLARAAGVDTHASHVVIGVSFRF